LQYIDSVQRLADLVTILYRPRETMARILARPSDRWAAHVVFLAFVCGSVNEIDVRAVAAHLPGLRPVPAMALVAVALIAGGLAWVLTLYILSWIATPVGRMMGGTAKTAGVRAALGWAMAPIIWSIVYRIPFAILVMRLRVVPDVDLHQVLLGFVAHGGCSLIVLYLAFQLAFAIWCIALACVTVSEAEQFELHKGFITVAVTIAFPLMVIAAAIITMR
jgi:hypothetical protein